MTENEQNDDPAAIQKWIDELHALPALSESPEQEAQRLAWEKRMREFNIEAVRRQMEEDNRWPPIPPRHRTCN